MTNPAAAFPFVAVALSGALASADAQDAVSNSLQGATYSGGEITHNSLTNDIAAANIGALVQDFNDNITYAERRVDGVTSSAVQTAHGKQDLEITMTVLVDYTTGSTYDLIKKDTGNPRLIYVEEFTGKKLTACVTLTSGAETNTQDGEKTIAVTLKNRGQAVAWE